MCLIQVCLNSRNTVIADEVCEEWPLRWFKLWFHNTHFYIWKPGKFERFQQQEATGSITEPADVQLILLPSCNCACLLNLIHFLEFWGQDHITWWLTSKSHFISSRRLGRRASFSLQTAIIQTVGTVFNKISLLLDIDHSFDLNLRLYNYACQAVLARHSAKVSILLLAIVINIHIVGNAVPSVQSFVLVGITH